MALRWGFGRKDDKDADKAESGDGAAGEVGVENAAAGAGAEAGPDAAGADAATDAQGAEAGSAASGQSSGQSSGDAPRSALPVPLVLLLGDGFARPLWEMRLRAAAVAHIRDAELKPDQLARARFEVIIDTEAMASDGEASGSGAAPDRAPALAPGGIVFAPCYVGSPTVMASELGAMAPRAVGYTLFAPPRGEGEVEPIIEVARAMQTADDAWPRALEFVRSLGFSPEVVGDAPGLVFGRILAMLINEAAFALQAEIASAGDIDAAMRLGVNYPKGLLAWADELGIQFVAQILDGLQAHYDEERYRAAPLLRHMILANKTFNPAPAEV